MGFDVDATVELTHSDEPETKRNNSSRSAIVLLEHMVQLRLDHPRRGPSEAATVKRMCREECVCDRA